MSSYRQMNSRSYQYPRSIRQTISLVAQIALLLNFLEYLLTWTRIFYGWFLAPLDLPHIPLLVPPPNILPTLLVAHVGLLVALIAARAVSLLAPRITILEHGYWMQTALSTRYVPFAALRNIRSIELPSGRFVVWVHSTKGLPLQNWLASLLFGRWLWRGFILTSDVQGFEELVGDIIARLKAKYGDDGFAAHYVDDRPTWLLTMLDAPRQSLRALAAAEESLPITTRQAVFQMMSASAALMLPMFVAALIDLRFTWSPIALFLIAIWEFPLGALYLSAVPLGDLRDIKFDDALRVYPLTQLPRWVVSLALTLFIAAGVPFYIFPLVVVPAIGVGCLYVMWLVEEWFQVRLPNSLMGVIVTAIYQIVLYEVFLVLLPR